MRATRCDARGRWFHNLDQARAREIFLLLDNFDDDFFAGNRVRHKDDAPGIIAPHRLTALGHRVKFQVTGFRFQVDLLT